MATAVISMIFTCAALLLAICGYFALRYTRRALVNRLLFGLCLALALSDLAQAVCVSAPSILLCNTYYRLSWFGWALYPAFALHISLLLTENSWWRRQGHWQWLLYAPALFILFKGTLGMLGISGWQAGNDGTFYPIHAYGIWDLGYLLYQYAFDVIALALIGWWGFTARSRRKKYQAVTIVFVAVIALVFDAIQYFAGRHGELGVLLSLEHLILACGLTYAVVRYKFVLPTTELAARNILYHMRDLVLMIGTDGTILLGNATIHTLLGCDETKVEGRHYSALFSPTSHTALTDAIHACQNGISSHADVMLISIAHDEIPLGISCSILRDEFDDIIGMILVGEDQRPRRRLEQEILERESTEQALREARAILEQQVADRTIQLSAANAQLHQDLLERQAISEALRESEEHYRHIFETIQDVFFRLDLAGCVLLVSPSVIAIFGGTPDAIIGMNIRTLLQDSTQFDAFVATLLSVDSIEDFEANLTHDDGRVITVAINAHLVRGAESEPSCIEGILRDVSARKHAEDAMRAYEQMLERAQAIVKMGCWELNIATGAVWWTPSMYALFALTPDAFMDGIITLCSPSVVNMMGYQSHEVIGHVVQEFAPEATQVERLFEALNADGVMRLLVWVVLLPVAQFGDGVTFQGIQGHWGTFLRVSTSRPGRPNRKGRLRNRNRPVWGW